MSVPITTPFSPTYITSEIIGPNDLRNFSRHVRVAESGCHEWTAFCNPRGYPRFETKAGHYAHRWVYLYHHGWVPTGRTHDVAHTCFNPGCVNIEHLEVQTRHQNMQDLAASRRPTCSKGHDRAEFGIKDAKNHWICTKCRADGVEKFKQAHPGRWQEISRASDARRRADGRKP